MKTILFTNARNEESILEWVVHHLNLGFTHIYIVDHKSDIPITDVLKNIPSEKITISRNDGDILKGKLIINAHAIALEQEYEWMLYLDCDEFLILKNHDTIDDFLSDYISFDQIALNWLCFGTNYLETIDGTLMENLVRCEPWLNPHVKTFLHLTNDNTKKITIQNPHAYILNDMSKSIGVNFKLMDHEAPHFFDPCDSFQNVSAYVAHYLFQSYDRYLKRKINIPRDDNGEFRDIISKEDLDSNFNQIENYEPLKKYNEVNKRFMEIYK